MALLTNPPEILAANIARFLKSRGWTQTQLAEESGIHRVKISRIMSAVDDHRLGTVDKIAKAFGVPISDLLTPASDEILKKVS